MDATKFHVKANAYVTAPEDDDVDNGGSAGYLVIARNEYYTEMDKLIEANVEDNAILHTISNLSEDRQIDALKHVVKQASVDSYIAEEAGIWLEEIIESQQPKYLFSLN